MTHEDTNYGIMNDLNHENDVVMVKIPLDYVMLKSEKPGSRMGMLLMSPTHSHVDN